MKLHYSMLVVAVVIGLNVWFANKVFDIILATSVEPTVLPPLWFGFTTGELWLLSKIKVAEINKDKERDRDDS